MGGLLEMALCALRFKGGGEMEGSWPSAARLLAFFAVAGFEDAMFQFTLTVRQGRLVTTPVLSIYRRFSRCRASKLESRSDETRRVMVVRYQARATKVSNKGATEGTLQS